MSPRRLTVKLAACGLAGAVLMVAVAWGCAICRDRLRQIEHEYEDRAWPVQVDKSWPTRATITYISVSLGSTHEDAWAGTGWFEKANWRGYAVYRLACGWPCHAFQCQTLYTTGRENHSLEMRGILCLTDVPGRGELPAGVIPTLPLWPGFALDTAFYGAIVFALWSAPAVIRRRIRKNRGRCPACDYDLRAAPPAAPCPECGSPPSTASTPSSGAPAQPAHSA
jgi:hypothetical protein